MRIFYRPASDCCVSRIFDPFPNLLSMIGISVNRAVDRINSIIWSALHKKLESIGSFHDRIRSFRNRAKPATGANGRRCFRWLAFCLPGVLGLILVVQTCALPIPLAFLLISADADPMTMGCSKKTCCTPLCYLDKNGVHHCVHMHDESCARNLSTHDSDSVPILYSTAVVISGILECLPGFHQTGWILETPVLAETRDPGAPSPPPKQPPV